MDSLIDTIKSGMDAAKVSERTRYIPAPTSPGWWWAKDITSGTKRVVSAIRAGGRYVVQFIGDTTEYELENLSYVYRKIAEPAE